MASLDFLQNPEMEYRTRNYWGWLENITPEETVWQIDRMYEAGLGGYVMHARGGLTIPYAGKQWMDSVRAMVKRGAELGMCTVIDDEHGWPSGFGAGKVNGKGEAYQLKYLLCEETTATQARSAEGTLGLWNGDFECVPDAGRLSDGEKLIRVYRTVDRYYVDNMDPKVVDAFLEASYEDYRKELTTLAQVHGIFSDEPQTARYATPWTDILPGLYEKRYGEPLLPQLVGLFRPVPGCEKLRIRVYGLMAECFAENYAGRIQNWCEKHGTAFMGHTCLEEHLVGQLRCALDTMPFYRYMTVPGIDWLCRVPLSNLAILQLTSVAQQTGKKRVLCEMFGCAGWNISLEEMKWQAQWMAAFGVNDHLQHLGLYSLRGSRKREYPASLHYQQPWYGHYRGYNDYFARVCKLLSVSRLETDLLVIHPMRSVWAQYDGTEHSCDDLQAELDTLLNDLLALNLSPHLGDETLLEQIGRVEDGRLVIGECSYSQVILPKLRTVSTHTLKLLNQFVNAGGRVVCIEKLPELVDGELQNIKLPCEIIPAGREALEAAFSAPVRVLPSSMVYVTRWKGQGRDFLYLTNNDLHNAAEFRLEAEGCWYEYDPLTNRLSDVPVDRSRMRLEGAQAMILFRGEEKPVPAPEAPFGNRVNLSDNWRVVSATGNALTLDHCQLSLDGVNWEEEAYILDIQKRLLTEGKNRDVYLRFRFRSKQARSLTLLVENPEKCAITLNGEPVSNVSDGWQVDKCLEKLPILCRAGENVLEIRRAFTNSERVYYVKNHAMHEAESNRVTVETELEAVYLWGSFAVRADAPAQYGPRRTVSFGDSFYLDDPSEILPPDNLTENGYPFFAGTVALEKNFRLEKKPVRAKLRFQRPDAIVTAITVNGTPVKEFFWAPYEADVTEFLREGENTVRVELTNSCRNLFGPHYSKDGESYAVGPFSFGKEAPHKQFVRFGLEGGITVEYD